MVRIRVCGTVEALVAKEMWAFHNECLELGKTKSFSESFQIVLSEGLREARQARLQWNRLR